MTRCSTCGEPMVGDIHADPRLNNHLGRANQFCDLLVLLAKIRAIAEAARGAVPLRP